MHTSLNEPEADLDSFESKLFSVHFGLLRTADNLLTQIDQPVVRPGLIPKCCAGRSPFYGRRFLVTQCVRPAKSTREAKGSSQACLCASGPDLYVKVVAAHNLPTRSFAYRFTQCSGSNKQRCDFIDYCYTERDCTLSPLSGLSTPESPWQ
jgi:hypothetical protein